MTSLVRQHENVAKYFRWFSHASIAYAYLIANHNRSWIITNTNVWSFQWADHELIWWTKWHEYFFIASVINKHQNDQWLQCHSISYARLLNIGLNTEVYLYGLKMRDTAYRHVTDSIVWHSHLSDILSCDKPCRINGFWLYIYIYIYIYIYVCVCVCVCVCVMPLV